MRANVDRARLDAFIQKCRPERGAGLADELERHVAAVLDIMAAIHGGRWTADVNHDTGFVIVAKGRR